MITTRRLAAILAADVAGYSAAMERDEEGTAAAVRTLRRDVIEPKLAEHQGRLIKTTGDGFLAEFASPIAALKCALAIQQRPDESSGLRLRIGLNLGDVIIEEGGDVLGEGVNVAARLEGIAEPGGILVSDKIVREVEGKVQATFEDCGEQQVKNISKPVRAYAVRTGAPANIAMPVPGRPLLLPDKPSIAVLPFQNMSGDPEQDYFADGMVEDIITALSRFKSLFVIARNSSFTYKGKAVDVKQVGRELGVRYVLEGSVRKAGGRVRITGQLIEAATGAHLWADKFDGTLKDIFELQDSITSSVVGVIAPQILKTEVEKTVRQPTKDLQAYDFYLRGIASTDNWTKAGSEVTLQMFARAIELDPNFAAAYARLALSYQNRQAQSWMSDPASEGAEAVRLARRAIEIAKDDAYVQAASGFILALFLGELDRGVVLVDRALGLNANDADAWRWSGWLRMYRGDEELAIEHFLKAQRLNPLDPYIFATFAGLAFALFFIDRREEARVWAERALAANANYLVSLRIMSAIQASLGEIDEARKITRRMQELSPMSRMANLPIIRMLRQPDQKEKLVQALRLAGVPE